ncbi:uroporphyrinogen III synthase [Campylobacter avium LMG 24591]|uniref:Uroporphyrinogen III synthase n=1 Tax=Campylobacter avium LMG 24591 TaxID=522484 RepID=A0A222MWW6_9BACT|nr:uroporphyrinogen-III synthase [Campylobacter avium]ASQ30130.1 uroporphyrinogen III synthase [Campylobacter avium LMG 24591]OYD79229.1 uroporphyrinogen III synthase [Campylobacter avium]
MIYLISAKAHNFKGVENICLSKIKLNKIKVNLKDFDTLITSSKNALKSLLKSECELNLKMQILTLSKESAQDFKKLAFKNVKTPKKAYMKDLLNEFQNELKDKKILYLRAKKVSFDLAKKAKNLNIKEIIAYENVYKKHRIKNLVRPCIFIFTSFDLADTFLKYYEIKDDDKIVAIGSSTALRLKEFKNIFISKKANIKECVKLARKLEKINS